MAACMSTPTNSLCGGVFEDEKRAASLAALLLGHKS